LPYRKNKTHYTTIQYISFPELQSAGFKMTYNFAVVGDPMCGKTTFVNRILLGEMTYRYNHTDYHRRTQLCVPYKTGVVDVEMVEFNVIWDGLGQEAYNGIIYMLDIMMLTEFNIPRYIEKINKLISIVGQHKPMVICGNKYDMMSDADEDSANFGLRNDFCIALHQIYPNIQYFDTSFKTCYNMTSPLCTLIEMNNIHV